MCIYKPGEEVLIRARVTDDGRSVRLGPGVEVGAGSVEIMTDLPVFDETAQPAALLMFFHCAEDRQAFAETFEGMPGVEPRAI